MRFISFSCSQHAFHFATKLTDFLVFLHWNRFVFMYNIINNAQCKLTFMYDGFWAPKPYIYMSEERNEVTKTEEGKKRIWRTKNKIFVLQSTKCTSFSFINIETFLISHYYYFGFTAVFWCVLFWGGTRVQSNQFKQAQAVSPRHIFGNSKLKKRSFYWTKSKVINETFLFKEFFISFRIVHTQAAWASNNNDIFLFGECNENKKKIRRLHTIQHSPFCTTKQKMDLNSHICVCLRRSWMKFALSYFARTN